MNKIRLLGLLLIIIGVIFHFLSLNSGYDLFTGIIFGIGLGLLITGFINKSRA